MEFGFTPEQEQFRKKVQEVLDRELTPEVAEAMYWDADSEITHKWQRRMCEQGWMALGWPKEYGGSARSVVDQAIFNEEVGYRGGFDVILQATHFIVGPVIIRLGSEEQKKKYLPLIAKGAIRCTNGLTEPNAGSDLAALSTRAEERGDYYVINGTKTFITGAHRVQLMNLATRTDPNVPSHKGISMFLVEMNTPGIKIVRMLDLQGKSDIDQVFFDDVKVHKSQMLGEKNRGWYALMNTLDQLRGSGSVQAPASAKAELERVVKYCQETKANGASLSKDPRIRNMLAQTYVDVDAWRNLAWKIVGLHAKGILPTVETSMCALLSKVMPRNMALMEAEIFGNHTILKRGGKLTPLDGEIFMNFVESSHHQAGGTREIQRNIIAQRGLSMPRG